MFMLASAATSRWLPISRWLPKLRWLMFVDIREMPLRGLLGRCGVGRCGKCGVGRCGRCRCDEESCPASRYDTSCVSADARVESAARVDERDESPRVTR